MKQQIVRVTAIKLQICNFLSILCLSAPLREKIRPLLPFLGLVESPASGASRDTQKPVALPSRAASCDRFAARLRLGQPDAFGAGASRD